MKLLLIFLVMGGTLLTACSDNLNGDATNEPTPLVTPINTKAHAVVSDFKAVDAGKILVPKPSLAQAELIKQALDNTNKLRAEKGLPALKYNPSLSAYAQVRAGELATLFEHSRPNGESYAKDMDIGSAVGENIAAGFSTADETVLNQWRNSKGHYHNIISSYFTNIGIGVVYVPNSKYRYYWVQIFGADDTSSRYAFDKASVHNPKPLESLAVNSVVVPLSPRAGNWQVLQGSGYLGWENGYDATRFGAIKFDNQDTQVFYQGIRTDSNAMPTAGRANYHGKAVVVRDSIVNTNGEVVAAVDFGTKRISGAIGENGQTLLGFTTDVQGNSFVSRSQGTEVQGAFFGAGASELGGVFKDSNTATTGAFGATKQP